MKILVAGLGLIGGSTCMALKRAGYFVAGWNRSPAPLRYALDGKIIDEAATDFTAYDLVFVVLPPEATADFICNNTFRNGAIVSDMCGVKEWLEEKVLARPRNFRYVGAHPMAGKEVSGIENACERLFDGASMILTKSSATDERALETVRSVVKTMGFARIVECSAAVHDRKIAYTSQLAHVVSNAYVKDGEMADCLGFTGGSFQDMTRIAGVDEGVWSSLYLKNAENLSKNIGNLISSLDVIKRAIESGDAEMLRKTLAEGRILFENGKKSSDCEEISVINLR